MTSAQESLFPLGSSLLDASLEQRAAAAQDLIETTPTDVDTRVELLVLVCWPAAWSEVER